MVGSRCLLPLFDAMAQTLFGVIIPHMSPTEKPMSPWDLAATIRLRPVLPFRQCREKFVLVRAASHVYSSAPSNTTLRDMALMETAIHRQPHPRLKTGSQPRDFTRNFMINPLTGDFFWPLSALLPDAGRCRTRRSTDVIPFPRPLIRTVHRPIDAMVFHSIPVSGIFFAHAKHNTRSGGFYA